MSFSIYAWGLQFKSGNTGIKKSKVLANEKNLLLGDEWEVRPLLSALSEFTPLGAAGSPTGSVAVSLMGKMAIMEAARILSQQVQLIAMNSNRGGKISISTKSINLVFDDHDYKRFYVSPKNYISFVKDLLEHLEKIGLNKLGILIEIIKALAEVTRFGFDGYFLVNIQLEVK